MPCSARFVPRIGGCVPSFSSPSSCPWAILFSSIPSAPRSPASFSLLSYELFDSKKHRDSKRQPDLCRPRSVTELGWFVNNVKSSPGEIRKKWHFVLAGASVVMPQMLVEPGAILQSRFTVDVAVCQSSTE